ncbi:MAG: hypothetical protein FWF57_08700 [Defluviitaleaceae bacterium]|nr:hypothetical protein [Defluviitaleaceae bacterium]
MNWSKAKTICIISFLILNIILFVLISLESRQYTLSSNDIRIISSVLNENDISLSENFRFLNHRPLRRILLTINNLNQNFIVNLLMINNTNISANFSDNINIFETESERVTFFNDRIKYENLTNNDLYFGNETEKRIFGANVLRSLNDNARNFVLDDINNSEDKTILTYRQMYQNKIIYTNFISFTFENNNIRNIEINMNPVQGFWENRREIRPSNEILLTAMRNITAPAIIENMDIVYVENNMMATPHHRIVYTKDRDTNIILINSYTNILYKIY